MIIVFFSFNNSARYCQCSLLTSHYSPVNKRHVLEDLFSGLQPLLESRGGLQLQHQRHADSDSSGQRHHQHGAAQPAQVAAGEPPTCRTAQGYSTASTGLQHSTASTGLQHSTASRGSRRRAADLPHSTGLQHSTASRGSRRRVADLPHSTGLQHSQHRVTAQHSQQR